MKRTIQPRFEILESSKGNIQQLYLEEFILTKALQASSIRNVFRPIFILTLVALSSCECIEDLDKICPTSVECWVEEGKSNVESNFVLDNFPGIANYGECTTGKTSCNDNMELFCEGVIYPVEEVCDFKDNNCDLNIDEGFDLDQDGVKTCEGDCDDNDETVSVYSPEICDGKDNDCVDGIPSNETTDFDGDGYFECEDCNDRNRDVHPGLAETCDNIDNNCNNIIDEDVIEANTLCGPETTVGVCTRDYPVCVDGEMYCIDAIYPTAESCDGVDNNCNGAVDELLIRECSTVCGPGIERCNNGEWMGCTSPQQTTEICDGIDNDCNGAIDDAIGGCPCEPRETRLCEQDVVDANGNLINCGVGIKECTGEREWGQCVWVISQPEVCNNYDDDCDGVVDNITQTCGNPFTSGIGQCVLGHETCTAGVWSECIGLVEPAEEICDEIDNDCDGAIDENLNPHNKVDMLFLIDGSGSMCVFIDALFEGIREYVSEFEGSEHKFGLVIYPYQFHSFPTQSNPNIPWVKVTDLTDVNEFMSLLGTVLCNYPGNEPGYDAMYDAALASNPMGISWREDAHPYIILMTDEAGELSWINRVESEVASKTADCRVGDCNLGEKFEVFVFTHLHFFLLWDEITFFETERLIDILPANAEGYFNKLRTIFTNVCR